jgi:thyroxine 5-deiodinase
MLAIFKQFGRGAGAPAHFLTIYIEEAHARDEWYFKESRVTTEFKAEIAVHKSIEERLAAAQMFRDRTQVNELELVVDSMKGEVVSRYGAWPERLYIIVDGVVVYKGGIGPFDYRLDEVRAWLTARFPDRE